MSLYLCIFERDRELAGVEVGGYGDFDRLRQHIAVELEAGRPGERFPVLMLHSDCEGEWPVLDCARLGDELAVIRAEMAAGGTLESFLDVDGEILIDQLARLAKIALAAREPILFQ